jgi:outer membrane protein TolC
VAVPEVGLAELDVAAASTDLELARAMRRPDFMVNVTETVMPDGMPMGTDLSIGVEVPLWGGKGREIDAARADLAAAAARQDRVLRDLAVAVEQGRAALEAAEARSEALDTVALPRARAAWDATLALFAAGTANEDDVVRAWETWLDVGREAVAARLDVQRRAAELARVEGT